MRFVLNKRWKHLELNSLTFLKHKYNGNSFHPHAAYPPLRPVFRGFGPGTGNYDGYATSAVIAGVFAAASHCFTISRSPGLFAMAGFDRGTGVDKSAQSDA